MYGVAEKKYLDYAFNPADGSLKADFTTVGTTKLATGWGNQVSLLSCMQQGNGEGQRIGNKIRVKYVQLSTAFAMINQSSDAGQVTSQGSSLMGMFCRYMVLLDRQPGGTSCPRNNMQPVDQLTFQTVTTGAGTNVIGIHGSALAFRDFNMLKRFKVKLDKQHNAWNTNGPTTVTGGVGGTTGARIEQHYIPMKNREFTFTSVGSATDMKTSANVMQGGDILYQAAPMDAVCCINMVKVRICYTDV